MQLITLLLIVLVKPAYYAPSTARNFWKLCPNYFRSSKLCFLLQNYASWFLSKINRTRRIRASPLETAVL